jgi:prepilin-type N-terminal cleavage/methylation domain-containing protein
MMRPRGFTLVEMMLATVLAAMLMAGVMTVASGLSRDRRRMEARVSDDRPAVLLDLIRRDLVNATAIVRHPDRGETILIGHGGLDPRTMTPSARLAKVTYRAVQQGRPSVLLREQRYLDDPIRPAAWSEIVMTGVVDFRLLTDSAGEEPVQLGEDVSLRAGVAGARAVRVPARARLRIEHARGVMDELVVVR